MIRPGDIHGKKILFGCLDWGSGHVARSIPLIAQLVAQQNEVIIWCSEKQEQVFRRSGLKVGYHIAFEQDFHFRGDGNFYLEMLRNAFRLFRKLRKERLDAAAFVKENAFDVIISDHRYGLHSQIVPSVFITHQVKLPRKSGWLAQQIHASLIGRFNALWIVDDERERLAGALSERTKNGTYIGYLSRFSLVDIPQLKTINYAAVISGPAAYAKQFYAKIERIARENPQNWVIICDGEIADLSSPVRHVHNWQDGDRAIASAETVVSRCGYSTLMDLEALKCAAILLPTPGQLEQQYLAKYLSGKRAGWLFPESFEELENLVRK